MYVPILNLINLKCINIMSVMVVSSCSTETLSLTPKISNTSKKILPFNSRNL